MILHNSRATFGLWISMDSTHWRTGCSQSPLTSLGAITEGALVLGSVGDAYTGFMKNILEISFSL
jgi:hypothetical protein